MRESLISGSACENSLISGYFRFVSSGCFPSWNIQPPCCLFRMIKQLLKLAITTLIAFIWRVDLTQISTKLCEEHSYLALRSFLDDPYLNFVLNRIPLVENAPSTAVVWSGLAEHLSREPADIDFLLFCLVHLIGRAAWFFFSGLSLVADFRIYHYSKKIYLHTSRRTRRILLLWDRQAQKLTLQCHNHNTCQTPRHHGGYRLFLSNFLWSLTWLAPTSL